jgi:hypothetical protein
MTYHQPDWPVVSSFMHKGAYWQIVQQPERQAFFARYVKYNSDTGPFGQAEDFARLRGQ